MKTLNDHVILYDKECPMCNLYTGAFVKTGMLGKDGRQAFTEADSIIDENCVNREKACDEIALIDTKSGKVRYGLESLTFIIGNRFPFFRILFVSPFFTSVVQKIYFFISYNRKVIIPGKDLDDAKSCRPSFSFRYRAAYIVFTWLITSFILSRYAATLIPVIPPTNFFREFYICGGQVVFQGVVVLLISRKTVFEYLGNMMTISFAGALLLLPGLLLQSVIHEAYFSLAWFLIVVSLMLLEHTRRVKLLHLPWTVSASWVLYRLIVLTLIFFL